MSKERFEKLERRIDDLERRISTLENLAAGQEKATAVEDPLTKVIWPNPDSLPEAVSNVLSFYGSEVISHASLLLGFVIGFLAIVQVRESLIPYLFVVAIISVIFGGVYSGLRVYYWATLSSILMFARLVNMEAFARIALDVPGNPRDRIRIPHAFVNEYALAFLFNKEGKMRDKNFFKKRSFFYRKSAILRISLEWVALGTSIALAIIIGLVLVFALQIDLGIRFVPSSSLGVVREPVGNIPA